MGTEVNSHKKYDEKQIHGSDAKNAKVRICVIWKQNKKKTQRVISSQRKVKLIWHYTTKWRRWTLKRNMRKRWSERQRKRKRKMARQHTHIHPWTDEHSKQSKHFLDAVFFFSPLSQAVKRCKGETDECDYTQRKQRWM